MTAEIVCECGNGCEMPHKHRDIASVSVLPLDVERAGGAAVYLTALIEHWDTAGHAMTSLIEEARQYVIEYARLSESGSPHPEPIYDSEGIPLPDSTWDPLRGESGSPTPPGEER